jgi:hypothetical protein
VLYFSFRLLFSFFLFLLFFFVFLFECLSFSGNGLGRRTGRDRKEESLACTACADATVPAVKVVATTYGNDSRTATVRKSCLEGPAPRTFEEGLWDLEWGAVATTTFDRAPAQSRDKLFWTQEWKRNGGKNGLPPPLTEEQWRRDGFVPDKVAGRWRLL